jgi:hypothetical protein
MRTCLAFIPRRNASNRAIGREICQR